MDKTEGVTSKQVAQEKEAQGTKPNVLNGTGVVVMDLTGRVTVQPVEAPGHTRKETPGEQVKDAVVNAVNPVGGFH